MAAILARPQCVNGWVQGVISMWKYALNNIVIPIAWLKAISIVFSPNNILMVRRHNDNEIEPEIFRRSPIDIHIFLVITFPVDILASNSWHVWTFFTSNDK